MSGSLSMEGLTVGAHHQHHFSFHALTGPLGPLLDLHRHRARPDGGPLRYPPPPVRQVPGRQLPQPARRAAPHRLRRALQSPLPALLRRRVRGRRARAAGRGRRRRALLPARPGAVDALLGHYVHHQALLPHAVPLAVRCVAGIPAGLVGRGGVYIPDVLAVRAHVVVRVWTAAESLQRRCAFLPFHAPTLLHEASFTTQRLIPCRGLHFRRSRRTRHQGHPLLLPAQRRLRPCLYVSPPSPLLPLHIPGSRGPARHQASPSPSSCSATCASGPRRSSGWPRSSCWAPSTSSSTCCAPPTR